MSCESIHAINSKAKGIEPGPCSGFPWDAYIRVCVQVNGSALSIQQLGSCLDEDPVIGHIDGTMLSRGGVPRVKEIFEGLSELHGDIRNVKPVSEEAADAVWCCLRDTKGSFKGLLKVKLFL